MPAFREIRADFDRDTIVVYQAYNDAIADAAIRAQKFAAPYSFGRMTWIKPSYLWLMARSNWGRKANQERILAVRIRKEGWNKALNESVLTSFEPAAHGNHQIWQNQFDIAAVHVQWDPERSIHGKKLEHRAIQVGLSRAIVKEFVEEWIVEITDLTTLTKRMLRLCEAGDQSRAGELLPREQVFDVPAEIRHRLGMS